MKRIDVLDEAVSLTFLLINKHEVVLFRSELSVATGPQQGSRGACVVAGGHVWLLGGMVARGCMAAGGHACMVVGGCAWLRGCGGVWLQGACVVARGRA